MSQATTQNYYTSSCLQSGLCLFFPRKLRKKYFYFIEDNHVQEYDLSWTFWPEVALDLV